MRTAAHAFVIILGAFLLSCSAPQSSETPLIASETVSEDATREPVAQTLSEPRKLVVLGDSLSAGFGLNIDDALPAELEHRLAARGIEIQVINAGVSGDTTANGLARYDWSVASVSPDAVLIALGANDYLLGLSPDLARENLIRLIERAQRDEIAVILAGLDPRTDAGTDSREQRFANIYPELSATHSLPLYPALLAGIRDNPDLLQGDGLHPNAAGVELMADNLTEFLAPLLVANSE